MRTKDFAFVGIRIVAIIFFVKAIHRLRYFELPVSQSPISITLAILSAALLIIASVLLWRFTDKISKLLIPKDNNSHEESTGEVKIELGDLQNAAFSVLGVFILSDIIPKIFQLAAEIVSLGSSLLPSSFSAIGAFHLQFVAKLLGYLAVLILGLYLAFKPKNIFASIRKGILKLRGEIDLEDNDEESVVEARETIEEARG